MTTIIISRALAALAALGVAAAPAASAAASVADAGVLPQAIRLGTIVKIAPPRGTGAASDALMSVSCSGAGSCTAGGYQLGPASQAMVVTESSGHWHPARSLLMPPENNVVPTGYVTGVGCSGPGNCVAVGWFAFTQPATPPAAFVAVQTRGSWGIAHQIRLPAGAQLGLGKYSMLNSVTCPAPGSCVAVGIYQGNLGVQAMEVTESGGKWTRAAKLGQPVNVEQDPKASMGSVTCTKPGNCVAVGEYADTGGNIQAAVYSRSGSKWHGGLEVKLPKTAETNPLAGLLSVSCPKTGACAAVGYYEDANDGIVPMALTITGGKPSAARTMAMVPAGAAGQPTSWLYSVSCPAAGACFAVGDFKTSSGPVWPMIVKQASGRWGQAIRMALPADATTGGTQVGQPKGSSCTSGGYCAVVGSYQPTTAGGAFAVTTK